jgi:hypothetical protein
VIIVAGRIAQVLQSHSIHLLAPTLWPSFRPPGADADTVCGLHDQQWIILRRCVPGEWGQFDAHAAESAALLGFLTRALISAEVVVATEAASSPR